MKRSLLVAMSAFSLGFGLFSLAGAETKAVAKPTAMITREFRTPPDFLQSAVNDKDRQNPFERKTAKETLEAWGIPFPEGATALFNPENSLLVVQSTPEYLEIVSALVEEETRKAPRNLVFRVTVIEASGKRILALDAAAAKKASVGQNLAELLALAKNSETGVRVVGDAWLEAGSGIRAVTESSREHVYASKVNLDAQGRSSLEMEMRQIGLRLELEGYLGAANHQIELISTLNLFPVPPQTRRLSVSDPSSGNPAEFPVSDVRNVQFSRSMSLQNGSTRILGIARPVGDPNLVNDNMLWIAFISAHVVPVEIITPLPEAKPPEVSKPDKQGKPVPILKKNALAACGVGEFEFYPRRILTAFFTLHTVQAAAPLLRDLSTKAARMNDHAAIWQEIENAATRGEVIFVDSHVLEAKSGVRAEISAASEHSYLASFATDAKGRPELTFEMRPMGSRLSLEPTISQDEHTVSVVYDYELHTAPPDLRRDVFRDPASRQSYDIPIPDFHVAHVQSSLRMSNGGTRLLTLWKPAGREGDVLQAVFLRCDVVRQMAKEKPLGALTGNTTPQDKGEWITQVFSGVPPDVVSGGKTMQQVLEEAGVQFPPGAKVYFNSTAGKVIVRTQRASMDLVEVFLDGGCRSYSPPMSFTTHIIQAPGHMLRRVMAEAGKGCDHRVQLERLLASPVVRQLGMSHIETKAGVRSNSEEVVEHRSIYGVNMDDKVVRQFEQEMRPVGFRMNVEPALLSDGNTFEMTLEPEFHTAEPSIRQEHIIDTQGRRLEFPLSDYHAAKLTTSILMPDNTVRLLGVWRPTGKPEFATEDILHAAFITGDVIPFYPADERIEQQKKGK